MERLAELATVRIAVERLRQGANIILHSSRGPDDPRIAETRDALRSLNLSGTEIKLHSGRLLGPKLGRILRGILTKHPLRRVGIAGGDTSGYIARELQLTALEAIAPVAPGSPLCRAHADNDLHNVEFFSIIVQDYLLLHCFVGACFTMILFNLHLLPVMKIF